MQLSFEALAYLGVFGILAYQLGAGTMSLVTQQKPLRALQFFLFLLFLSSELSRPFFPIFAADLHGSLANKELASALPQMVWGISALVATPMGWLLAKKIGTRNILGVCAVLTTAGLAITALTSNYWMMLGARSLVSAAYGVANIVAVLYLARLGNRAKVMATLLAAIATSSICGSAIGGLLTTTMSFEGVFALSAAVAVLAAIALQRVVLSTDELGDRSAPKIAYRKLLGNGKVQAFAILSTMPYRFVLTGVVLFLLPVLLTAHHLSLKTVGQVMTAYFLLNYLLVAPVASFLDKYNCYRAVAVGSTVLTGIGLLLLSQSADNISSLFLAVAVLSVGVSLNNSVQIPIVPQIFKRECQTFGKDTLLAYFRTVERVGSVLGPMLTALLYRAWPESAVAVIGGALLIMSAGLALLLANPKEVGAQSSGTLPSVG